MNTSKRERRKTTKPVHTAKLCKENGNETDTTMAWSNSNKEHSNEINMAANDCTSFIRIYYVLTTDIQRVKYHFYCGCQS